MRNKIVAWSLLGSLVFLPDVSQAGAIHSGRAFDNENDRPFSINLTLGQFNLNSGEVKETRRAYDNNENPSGYEAYLSSYSFDELGLVGSYPTYGISFEKQWKFFTLRVEGSYINADASGVADMHETASNVADKDKGYYISVDEVSFNGRTYEYMFIPNGQSFNASIDGGSAAIRGLISTINGGFSEQITQLDNHGRTLSDPNNWDGPLAQQFRTSTWPETKAALDKAKTELEELQMQLDKISQNIFSAGGG